MTESEEERDKRGLGKKSAAGSSLLLQTDNINMKVPRFDTQQGILFMFMNI